MINIDGKAHDSHQWIELLRMVDFRFQRKWVDYFQNIVGLTDIELEVLNHFLF